MSNKTKARRFDVKNYTENERQELIGHLISGTQPQRRMFLGKISDFTSKEEEKYHKKMLKAYLKGALFFYPGEKMQKEVMVFKFDKEKGKKVPTGTGIFEEVLKPVLVRQMYFFN